MGKTKIEWTRGNDGSLGEAWNPVTGCSHVSEGCRNCYAEAITARFRRDHKPWTAANAEHNVLLHPERLEQPLHWRKPRRVFVNSMSDLFHEAVPAGYIGMVFERMRKCERHIFQVLTKRADRMMQFCSRLYKPPLQNVWLGVSIEDQATADERIPLLLQTPAAVRFVSYEPALGPVNLDRIYVPETPTKLTDGRELRSIHGGNQILALRGERITDSGLGYDFAKLDWVIVGGESGPKARPCDLAWIRSVVEQCKAASIPCFVKQVGVRPFDSFYRAGVADQRIYLKDHKGGNPDEWPEDLRVREFPR